MNDALAAVKALVADLEEAKAELSAAVNRSDAHAMARDELLEFVEVVSNDDDVPSEYRIAARQLFRRLRGAR